MPDATVTNQYNGIYGSPSLWIGSSGGIVIDPTTTLTVKADTSLNGNFTCTHTVTTKQFAQSIGGFGGFSWENTVGNNKWYTGIIDAGLDAADIGALCIGDNAGTSGIGGGPVRNKLRIHWGANAGATLYGTMNATAFNATSDERLKKDIYEISTGLDAILQLNPVAYKFKEEEEERLGFLAQQVQEVLPTSVRQRHDEYLSLDHNQILPVLVNAVKELYDMVVNK
jgi:hypothetical protein